jgi:large repetitive protein
MRGMFRDAPAFSSDLSAWDVSSVNDMSVMFFGASNFTSDLSGWTVGAVTTMNQMFRNAALFNSNLGSWNISAVTDMTSMMQGSAFSDCNYDATLMGWAQQPRQNNVVFHAGNARYTLGSSVAAARQTIIDNSGWTITDGGAVSISITPDGPTTFCDGGSVTLEASTGAGYLWSPNGETTQSIVATQNGSYSVTITDANGCERTTNATDVVVNNCPQNDLCVNAIDVSCGSLTNGTILDATITGSPGICGEDLDQGGGVWYSFTGTGDVVTVDFTNVDFEAILGVFSGNCGNLTCVAGRTFVDNGEETFWNPAVFLSSTAVEYLIYVSGFEGDFGDFTMSLNCNPPLENDLCSGAIDIDCNSITTGTTIGATALDAPTDCVNSLDNVGGVWYKVVGTGETFTADLCSDADFDTKLAVFRGPCGALTCEDSNDDACGLQSSITFNTDAEIDYYIYVTGYEVGEEGLFELTLSGCTPPIANDECEGAIPLSINELCEPTTVNDATGATDSGIIGCLGTAVNDLWYSFIAPANGKVSVGVFGSATFDAMTEIFSGGCEDLTSIACSNVSVEGAQENTPLTGLIPGETYYARVYDDMGNGSHSPFGYDDFGVCVEEFCTVNASPTPTITAGGPTTFCAGGNVELTATAGISYLWSTGETSQSVNVTESDSYSVTVTDANGCEGTSVPTNVTVNPNPAVPTITSSGPTDFCEGTSITLTSSETSGNTWSPNGETTQSIVVTEADNFSVTFTDANGCSASSGITSTTVLESPVHNVGSTSATCSGASDGSLEAVYISGQQPISYTWSDGQGGPVASNLDPGSYFLTSTGGNGCSTTQYAIVNANFEGTSTQLPRSRGRQSRLTRSARCHSK